MTTPDTTARPLVALLTPMRRAEMAAGAFIAGYSRPATQRNYSTGMRDFFAYLLTIDAEIDPIVDVRRGHIDTYLRSLEARGMAASSVGRRVSTLAMFYRWLVAEEYLDRDPCLNVKRPKVPRGSTREWLTRRELADWISAAEREGGYPYALACLLAFNGLRISEACGADIEGLGKHRYHHTLAIVGKGQEPERVVLPGRTLEAIQAAIGDRDHGPLLLTQYATRMNREAAGRIVRRFALEARIPKNVTPHSLRHSAITALLEANPDITAARDFARHVDVSTTQIYDRRRRKLDAAGSYAIANFIAEVEA